MGKGCVNGLNRPTVLQRRFLRFYRESGDAEEAARRAGYKHPRQAAIRNACLLADETGGKKEDQSAGEGSMAGSSPREEEADCLPAAAGEEEVMRVLTRIIHRKEADHVILKVKTKKSYLDERGKRITEESTEDRIAEVPARLSDINRAAELLVKSYGGGLGAAAEEPGSIPAVQIIDDVGKANDGG